MIDLSKTAVVIVCLLCLFIAILVLAPFEDVYVCSDPKANIRKDGVFDCRSWTKTKQILLTME
jgi:hypothetical protein